MKMKAAIDLGNGYVKGNVNGEVLSFPSVVATPKKSSLEVSEAETDEMMDRLIDKMAVSFISEAVSSTKPYIFNEQALSSGRPLLEFNVFDKITKAQNDLTTILILATIAQNALVSQYKQTGQLGNVAVEAKLVTALPIDEIKLYKQAFIQKLAQQEHTIVFNNFYKKVTVTINFEKIMVISEGEAAQYALKLANEQFKAVIEKECRNKQPELDMSVDDILSAKNTLGIDIGEGTIDFPVFNDGKFNQEASSSINVGFGNLLEAVADDLNYPSRKTITEFLQRDVTAITQNKRNKIMIALEDNSEDFVDTINKAITKVISKTGENLEAIFVYGGGATPLESLLFDRIKAHAASASDNDVPIVYLDSQYSRMLNLSGLVAIVEKL
ncbi:ParM/StbA family protein [Pseudolactococcus yaeyamensis]